MSMTTELIKRLRQHADTFEKSGFAVDGLVRDYRESADTIQFLSEKLHASQTEPCKDAISRQAAIDAVRGSVWAQNHIKNLPSVQPQKMGKWIKDEHGYQYKWVCSNCKLHHRAMYNFCPSCGAKMEEGD